MRKSVVCPILAVALGAAGPRPAEVGALHRLRAGDRPGHPRNALHLALICWSACWQWCSFCCAGANTAAFTADLTQAFAAKGNTVYVTAAVLGGFLLLASAVLLHGLPAELPGGRAAARAGMGGTPVSRSAARVLGLSPHRLGRASYCTGKTTTGARGEGKCSFGLLLPAYALCLWLIAAYQVRAGDPVRQDYIYELFAIICALLGLYYPAGFSFERARPFRTGLFSLLGRVLLPGDPGRPPRSGHAAAVRFLCVLPAGVCHSAPRPGRAAPSRSGAGGTPNARRSGPGQRDKTGGISQ